MKPIDVLIVGAGPAGLAAAIRIRQQLAAGSSDASVVVVDKAANPGYHGLSGAAFEPAVLDELLPGWRTERDHFTEHLVTVERDELYYLLAGSAVRVPNRLVPGRMHHRGDLAISVTRLIAFLARHAERLGAEVYHGYAARQLIVEDGTVRGVRLGEVGRNRDGSEQPNYRPPEEVRAGITILADGSRGVLSTQFGEHFGAGPNPPVYSLGIKAIVQFADENPFGNNRVLHTIGYPNRAGVFGGGFVYSMGEKTAAVGLILGLDWKYADLNPQREFETYRAHPFIAGLLKGSATISTGAKTIPEGGYYALKRLSAPGAMVVGDGAGFVNMEKIKGIHYAIGSGMAAADTAVAALAAGDTGAAALATYRNRLKERGILDDLRHARNYRQSFRGGLYLGASLSLIQSHLPGRLRMGNDREATRATALLERPDPGGMDGPTFVGLAGSVHREDEPSHVQPIDPQQCITCIFDRPCTEFCPGQVYRWSNGELVLSPSNCLHCMTCTVKCPTDNIRWLPPEGGEGPRYKQM